MLWHGSEETTSLHGTAYLKCNGIFNSILCFIDLLILLAKATEAKSSPSAMKAVAPLSKTTGVVSIQLFHFDVNAERLCR